MRLALTTEREAELAERFPHEANQTLMADFGITKGQLSWFATTRGLKKTAEVRSRLARASVALRGRIPNVSQMVVDAIAAAGDAGLDIPSLCAALPQLMEGRIRASVYMLTKRGTLARKGGYGEGRWFATGIRPPKRVTGSPKPRAARASNRQIDAPSRAPATQAPAPRHGPAYLPGEPDLSNAKRSIGRAPPTQAEHTEPGLFANLGPGHYLDAEAKSWVTAITTQSNA